MWDEFSSEHFICINKLDLLSHCHSIHFPICYFCWYKNEGLRPWRWWNLDSVIPVLLFLSFSGTGNSVTLKSFHVVMNWYIKGSAAIRISFFLNWIRSLCFGLIFLLGLFQSKLSSLRGILSCSYGSNMPEPLMLGYFVAWLTDLDWEVKVHCGQCLGNTFSFGQEVRCLGAFCTESKQRRTFVYSIDVLFVFFSCFMAKLLVFQMNLSSSLEVSSVWKKISKP